jgi:flavin-dependent dehydrogenase
VTGVPDLELLDTTGRPHLVLGSAPPAGGPAGPPPTEPGPVSARTRPSPTRDRSGSDGWDVIVVGGGPAGSLAAGTLAARGRRVLLLEASASPQARVGESLSPSCLDLVDELGAGPAVRKVGSVPKTGATFLWGAGTLPWSVRYQPSGAPAAALHVRRAEFDEALRQAAAARGAEVRRGCVVERVLFEEDRAVGVRLGGGHGSVAARWIIDASGAAAVLARQLGIIASRPGRSGTAVWSYWTEARRLTGGAADDSLYVGGTDRCWWYLPVGDDPPLTAVGVWDRVASVPPTWNELERWYDRRIAATPVVAGLLAGARRDWPVQAMPAAPYAAATLAGPGWLLAGDAGGFVDPILTPGVQLACEQGVCAARVLDTLLTDQTRETAALAFYDAVSRRPQETFAVLCGNLYGAADARDHTRADAGQLEFAGGEDLQPDAGRTTFLATISGLPPDRLHAALGIHLGRRAAAAGRGGTPPQFGETEGFAFLSRVVHERRLATATTPTPAAAHPTGVRTAPGVEVGDHAFLDPDPAGGLVFRPAVSNRFGDRFALTPALRAALLSPPAPAGPAGTAPGWLELLAENALVERESAAPARAAREATGSCAT